MSRRRSRFPWKRTAFMLGDTAKLAAPTAQMGSSQYNMGRRKREKSSSGRGQIITHTVRHFIDGLRFRKFSIGKPGGRASKCGVGGERTVPPRGCTVAGRERPVSSNAPESKRQVSRGPEVVKTEFLVIDGIRNTDGYTKSPCLAQVIIKGIILCYCMLHRRLER